MENDGMEWNGMEWNGMEWNGMEWNGIWGYLESTPSQLFFFAKADLVRDLRPLALPCCSNDYGGAKSGGKRISLRKSAN